MTEHFTGAIPLLRKFQEHPFWREKRPFSRAEAWIDLLFMARYGDEDEILFDKGESITIQYSQILTSTITLMVRWKRSSYWVKKFLNFLQKSGSIVIVVSNTKRTIIQIVNMRKVKLLLQQSKEPISEPIVKPNADKSLHKNNVNKGNNSSTGISHNFDKRELVSRLSINQPTNSHQEQAYRYAKNLKIDLEDDKVKEAQGIQRWVKLFKDCKTNQSLNRSMNSSYSTLADNPTFMSLTSLEKIKYFFWTVSQTK